MLAKDGIGTWDRCDGDVSRLLGLLGLENGLDVADLAMVIGVELEMNDYFKRIDRWHGWAIRMILGFYGFKLDGDCCGLWLLSASVVIDS